MQIVVFIHTAAVSAVLSHVTVGEVSVRCHEITAVEVHSKVGPELEHILLRRITVVHRLDTLRLQRHVRRVDLNIACIHFLELFCTRSEQSEPENRN